MKTTRWMYTTDDGRVFTTYASDRDEAADRIAFNLGIDKQRVRWALMPAPELARTKWHATKRRGAA